VERDGGLVSTLDLVGDGLTLFAGPESNAELPSDGPNSPPSKVERLDGIAARGLGLMPAGSVLVRADGYPVALRNQSDTLAKPVEGGEVRRVAELPRA
jgi:hypothetical protein